MFSRLSDRLNVDMSSLLSNQIRQAEHDQNDEDEMDVCSIFPSLTLQERLGGCIGCMVLGYLLSFGSLLRFKDLLLGNPIPFVLATTTGNIISLCGSCFLSGPSSQISKMFHESRKTATIMYLSSLVITIIFAFALRGWKGQPFVLVLLLIWQCISVAWYCLSYIPFARQMASRFCARVYSRIEDFD